MGLILILGYVAAAILGLEALYAVVRFLRLFVLPKAGFRYNLSKLGQWAIVTGSTDGIGKGYAKALARRGLNVYLISRNYSKLQDVEKEIKAINDKIDVKILAIDFSKLSDIYSQIESEIANLDIGVLVNNVGVSCAYPEYYLDIDKQVTQNIVNVNIVSINEMTRVVLPKMVAKKKGAIINIASISAETPTPLLAVYAASKSYVDSVTLAFQKEYQSKGIIIQSVLPAFVCSNMSKIRRSSLFAPSADTFATSALNTVGIANRTHGYWPHELQACITNLLPRSAKISLYFSQLSGLRVKALKYLTKQK
ncbi:Very-long-chain 3-oxoacyl-CoA reductase [Trichoplax sp. H2]|nr:Very-long-chain 3-oxoacyl-CoA reductase [Trichoplax sp. H2]|eukprot:RDD37998.1 Very-long-chain 3-oxoacyl-CoA reductase [Trichoplax sp. H2]